MDLLLALGLGFALGLVYDLLRPQRRRWAGLGTVLDLLFCLLAAGAAFAFAMGAGGGRWGLWELTASLLGFLLYLHTASRLLLPVLDGALALLCRMGNAMKIFSRKCINSAKNLFQNMRK